MKKTLKTILTISSAIVLSLIITNPTPKEFKENLSVITNLPNKVFETNSEVQALVYQGRKMNYFVFSIYTIKSVSDIRLLEKNLRVLGIAGNFYVLKKK